MPWLRAAPLTEEEPRIPITGIFAGCCADAGTLSAKSKAQSRLSAKGKGLSVKPKNLFLMGSLQRHAAHSSMLLAPCYFMTLSARASTFGGIPTILDFRFWIFDCSIIGLLDLL
jgi:hypothetical protein